MHTIQTHIEIDAPVDKVWKTLTEFEEYSAWNPFVTEISGELSTDSKLQITLSQPESKPMSISPRVVRMEKGRAFGWKGHLGVPGIFDGEHGFELEELARGRTRLNHFESFSGLLVPFLKKMLNDKTRRGFESMNEALKEKVEGA